MTGSYGGVIDIFVQRVDPAQDKANGNVFGSVLSAIAENKSTALARIVEGPADLIGKAIALTDSGVAGTTGDPEVDAQVVAEILNVVVRAPAGVARSRA